MINITQGEWIADLGAMKCRNYIKNIIVKFESNGNELVGKLDVVPEELLAQWADEYDGEKHVEKTLIDAEEVFLRAYFES
jgi:hypothetical protein